MPKPLKTAQAGLGMMAYLEEPASVRLHRWRFDLATGKTKEQLDDRNLSSA